MMPADGLLLRDIHQPPAPSWWPPAPGWWLLFAAVALALAIPLWLRSRRRRQTRALMELFDTTVASAQTPAAKIGAMSELLRRAARRIDPHADVLVGDDWLRFLDAGLEEPVFSAGLGLVLRDGAFRRDIPAAEVDVLQTVARRRFLSWMSAS